MTTTLTTTMTTSLTITRTTVPAGSATPTNLPVSAWHAVVEEVHVATQGTREKVAPAA